MSSVVHSLTSPGCMARNPAICGVSGNLYNLIVRAMVIRGANREKPISISFLGSSERWK